MSDDGINTITDTRLYLENVNVGVEIANTGDDINLATRASVVARDLKLGGTNGDVLISMDVDLRIG